MSTYNIRMMCICNGCIRYDLTYRSRVDYDRNFFSPRTLCQLYNANAKNPVGRILRVSDSNDVFASVWLISFSFAMKPPFCPDLSYCRRVTDAKVTTYRWNMHTLAKFDIPSLSDVRHCVFILYAAPLRM